MTPRVLVAGVGNVFLGDDGFGVEVAHRLSSAGLPEWVRVVDYGVRGVHLAYDLAGGGQHLTVLVDATTRGGPPGTVYVVELDTTASADESVVLDAHGMQPDRVLGLVRALGEDPGRVLLVGCEPAAIEQRMGLSAEVARAVDPAVEAVRDIVATFASEEQPCVWASPAK